MSIDEEYMQFILIWNTVKEKGTDLGKPPSIHKYLKTKEIFRKIKEGLDNESNGTYLYC